MSGKAMIDGYFLDRMFTPAHEGLFAGSQGERVYANVCSSCCLVPVHWFVLYEAPRNETKQVGCPPHRVRRGMILDRYLA